MVQRLVLSLCTLKFFRTFNYAVRLLLILSILKIGLILDYPHLVKPFKMDTSNVIVSVVQIFLNFS